LDINSLKILLVHNFYGSSAPSGENTAFLAEKEMLKKFGHEIVEYTTNSDFLRAKGLVGNIIGALGVPWNPYHLYKVRKLLVKEKPDIMHVNNTFPILSPSIFHATKNTNTASVLTLHNYRIGCAAGVPIRSNLPCTECIEKNSIIPSMKYRCYRHSLLATIPMAIMISLHRAIETWDKHIDAFIALTDFQTKIMGSSLIPEKRIYVKPHFYNTRPKVIKWNKRELKVVYIGRLSEEKGVKNLVEAWKLWGDSAPELEIIGSGHLSNKLNRMIQEKGLEKKIKLLGQLSFNDTQKKLAFSRLLILPSICFEGFPMVLREAYALRVPVAVSRLGAMASIVNEDIDGIFFKPGDSSSLFKEVSSLWKNEYKLAEMAKEARLVFERKYTSEKNHKILLEIYKKAIDYRTNRKSGLKHVTIN